MLTDWYEFLDNVRAARVKLNDPEIVWFRGHSSAAYSLLPSIHRVPDGVAKKQASYHEFERCAARLFKKRKRDYADWGTLSDMQHYGIPTRLLDWTETLGVAVAFAVLDHNPAHGDAAVFVLEPVVARFKNQSSSNRV